jgi:hypothetical protein
LESWTFGKQKGKKVKGKHVNQSCGLVYTILQGLTRHRPTFTGVEQVLWLKVSVRNVPVVDELHRNGDLPDDISRLCTEEKGVMG